MRSPAGVYVLDSCALIAFFRQEQGIDEVRRLIKTGNALMHSLNLCEVYYDTVRAEGNPAARQIFADAPKLVTLRDDMDSAFLIQAGDLKARGNIALADCFAAALSMRTGGIIITADHREFEPVAASGLCRVLFFR